MTTPRIDGGRLLGRIGELARIGATAAGGVTRLAFTPEEADGRRLVAAWMREAGLDAALDPAANLIGWKGCGPDPARPAVVLGSHLDTVVEAGALDGAYGVLAAVEVAAALDEAGVELARPLAVVAFNDEEGAFGTRGMWGAHALTGTLTAEDVHGPDTRGISVAESLRAAGGDPERVAAAAWPAGSVAAYLELHVEQGPVLDRAGIPTGVVEAIDGRVNAELVVRGEANHAGATPMDARRDALVAAARLVLAVRELATDHGAVRVATTGTIAVEPGVWNVIPGTARLGVELRAGSSAALDGGLALLAEAAARVGTASGTSVEVLPGARVEPVPCDQRLRALLAASADRLGLALMDLPSGAGHDAQVMTALGPVGMAFVPSRGGISHAPAEATDPAHLVAGAELLLAAVLDLDAGDFPRNR